MYAMKRRMKGVFRSWAQFGVGGLWAWSFDPKNLELFLLQFHSHCAGRALGCFRVSSHPLPLGSTAADETFHPHESNAVIMSLYSAPRGASTMSRRAGSRSDLNQAAAHPYARAEAVAQRGSNGYSHEFVEGYSHSFSRGSMTGGQVWVNTCCFCCDKNTSFFINTRFSSV